MGYPVSATRIQMSTPRKQLNKTDLGLDPFSVFQDWFAAASNTDIAWCSPQSSSISSRDVLMEKLDEIKREFANRQVPLPSMWGGIPSVAAQNRVLAAGPGSTARSISIGTNRRLPLEFAATGTLKLAL